MATILALRSPNLLKPEKEIRSNNALGIDDHIYDFVGCGNVGSMESGRVDVVVLCRRRDKSHRPVLQNESHSGRPARVIGFARHRGQNLAVNLSVLCSSVFQRCSAEGPQLAVSALYLAINPVRTAC